MTLKYFVATADDDGNDDDGDNDNDTAKRHNKFMSYDVARYKKLLFPSFAANADVDANGNGAAVLEVDSALK